MPVHADDHPAANTNAAGDGGGGTPTFDVDRKLRAALLTQAKAHLDVAEVRAAHRRLKATPAWRKLSARWREHHHRQPVPETLVAAVRSGDLGAADVLAAATNDLLANSPAAADLSDDTFADVAAGVDWLVGNVGPSLTLLWAAASTDRWREWLFLVDPAVFDHPDLPVDVDELLDTGHDPTAVAVTAACQAVAQWRTTGAVAAPFDELTLDEWLAAVDTLQHVAHLDDDELADRGFEQRPGLAALLQTLLTTVDPATVSDDATVDDPAAGPDRDVVQDGGGAVAPGTRGASKAPAGLGSADAAAIAADRDARAVGDAALSVVTDVFSGVGDMVPLPDGLTRDRLADLLERCSQLAPDVTDEITGQLQQGLTVAPVHGLLLGAYAQLTRLAWAELDSTEVTAEQLIRALRRPKTDPRLLRLAAVSASDASAQPAAEALREAAAAALAGDSDGGALTEIVDLLDRQTAPNHAELAAVEAQLPAALSGVVLAVATGVLDLPDDIAAAEPEGGGRGPDDPAAASTGDADPPADGGVDDDLSGTDTADDDGPDAAEYDTGDDSTVDHARTGGDAEPDVHVQPDTDPAGGDTGIGLVDGGSDALVDPAGVDTDAPDADETDADDPDAANEDGPDSAEPATHDDIPVSDTDAEETAVAAGDAAAGTDDTGTDADTDADDTDADDTDADDTDADDTDADNTDTDGRTGGEVDPAQLDAAWISAVDRSDYGAAAWIATAADQPRRAEAARLLAYATAMRRDGGAAGAAYDDTSVRVDPDEVASDPAARLLVLTAAVRASLIRPYLSSPFLDKVGVKFTDQPHTHALVTTLVDAARNGVSIGTSAPSPVRSDATDDAAQLQRRAADLLERGQTTTSPYQAATHVWQAWIDPDHGRVGKLVAAVAADDRRRADDVTRDVADLRKPGKLDREIDTTPQHKTKTERIVGRARRWIHSKAGEALDLVEEWLDHHHSATRQESLPYVDAKAAELRSAVKPSTIEAVYAELAEGCCDPPSDAAGRAAQRELDDVFARLRDGRPYTGADRDPALAANQTLLTTRVPLDIDTLEPDPGPLRPADAVRLADPPTLVDAFHARADAGDIDEATRILELLDDGDGVDTGRLRDDLEAAANAAQHAAADAWQGAQSDLLEAQRQGWLGPADTRELTRQLEAVAPTAESLSTERTDLGRAIRTIDRIRGRVAEGRDRRIAERLEALDLRAGVDDHLDGHYDRIRAAIVRGDLLVADDLERLIDEGAPPTAAARPESPFTQTFRDAVAACAQLTVDDDVVAAIRSRGTVGPIVYDALSARQADDAAAAAATWQQLATDRNAGQGTDAPEHVAQVLRALGMDAGSKQIVRSAGRGGRRYYWYEIRRPRIRGAPVPQFGSRAAVWQVLLSWGLDDQSLVATVAEEAHHRPTLVLRFDTAGAADRARLVDLVADARVPMLVVDTATFVYRLSLPDELWGTTLRATLPYTAANPFIRRGQVPAEMFKGRDSELLQLRDFDGPAVVYGGRQLGKTALLRRAEEDVNLRPDAVAVYHDIYQLPAQQARQLWGQLHTKLSEKGVSLPTARRDTGLADAVRSGLRTWLADDPARQVMILLDECDVFLSTDRDSNFREVADLKRLMEDSPGQCKVVFSGLHTVQRFAADPNQPFPHLGGAIQVGGLPPQGAYDLLADPLRALGYRFDDPDTVTRMIVLCNYAPAVLQEFGYALVNHLISHRDGTPPWTVSADDVRDVYDSDTLRRVIREKFQLTLSLDRHYALVANVMALRAIEQGDARTPWAVAELRDECRYWWPQGFRDGYARTDQFRLLLDEMVGLGVLTHVDGRYALLNANVRQLLGTDAEVTEKLVGFERLEPDPGYQADRFRRRLEAPEVVPSPLTDRQVGDVFQPRSAARVVLASDALGGRHLSKTLQQRAAPLRDVHFDAKARPFWVKGGDPKVESPSETIHRVVLVDVSDKHTSQVQRTLVRAHAYAHDPATAGTTTVLVQLGPGQLAVWRDLLRRPGDRFDLIGFRRFGPDTLRLWADSINQTLEATDAVDATLEATGGWPLLLADAAALVVDGSQPSLTAAASHLTADFDRVAGELVAATGLDGLDEQAAAAWEVLVQYGEAIPVDDFDQLWAGQLHRSVSEAALAAAARERELLDYLQVVVVRDGTIAAEPVAAEAWRAAARR